MLVDESIKWKISIWNIIKNNLQLKNYLLKLVHNRYNGSFSFSIWFLNSSHKHFTDTRFISFCVKKIWPCLSCSLEISLFSKAIGNSESTWMRLKYHNYAKSIKNWVFKNYLIIDQYNFTKFQNIWERFSIKLLSIINPSLLTMFSSSLRSTNGLKYGSMCSLTCLLNQVTNKILNIKISVRWRIISYVIVFLSSFFAWLKYLFMPRHCQNFIIKIKIKRINTIFLVYVCL